MDKLNFDKEIGIAIKAAKSALVTVEAQILKKHTQSCIN